MVPIKVSADIPADLNGNGVVDKPDLMIVGEAFGSTPNNPRWNEKADLNKDEKINVLDAGSIGVCFGDTNIQWISLLTLLNQIFQQEFVALAIGLYASCVFFLLKGKKLVVIVIYVEHRILTLLRRYIHIR